MSWVSEIITNFIVWCLVENDFYLCPKFYSSFEILNQTSKTKMSLEFRMNNSITIIICCISYSVIPLINRNQKLTCVDFVLLAIACFVIYYLNLITKNYKEKIDRYYNINNKFLTGYLESKNDSGGILYVINDNYQYDDNLIFQKIERDCEIGFLKNEDLIIKGVVINNCKWHVDKDSDVYVKRNFIRLLQKYDDAKQTIKRSFALVNHNENVEIVYRPRDDGSKYIVSLAVGKTFTEYMYLEYVIKMQTLCILYVLSTLVMCLYK